MIENLILGIAGVGNLAMTLLDRYLLFLFLKTFLVCFLSFTGLYVVVHLFSNLDELIAIGQSDGWWVIGKEFYAPKIAELFDKIAGILILVAAIFSVSLMQRRREMTAIEASGITKARILRPIFVTAMILIVLSIVNRELLIPQVKEQLVLTPQNWGNQGEVDLAVQEDLESGVILRGAQLLMAEHKITNPDIQIPIQGKQGIQRIYGAWAVLEPETESRPAGLHVHDVSTPSNLDQLASQVDSAGQPVVLFPSNESWLGPRECFVVCNFDAQQMAYGDELANYQTTAEMIKRLHQPRRWFGRGDQVSVHSRLVRPVLDLTLLMLGLPLMIGGRERNVFVSAGIGFWIIAGIQLTTIASHHLGASSLLRPAALSAWLPVALFFPFAVVAMRKLKA